MSQNTNNANVTTIKVTNKTVSATDADGWTTVQRKLRPKKDKNTDKKPYKTKTQTTDSAPIQEQSATIDDVPAPVVVETTAVKVVPPPTFSHGKGYLAAIKKGMPDATPIKTTVVVVPGAPKKSMDAESVHSDSSDSASRRLSFSEAPVPAGGGSGTKRYAGTKKPNTTATPAPSSGAKRFTGPPKRTEEESKAHKEYVAGLRAAENDFLTECLPSDKEKVTKGNFELEKIRNHSVTVHEVSFGKDFAPVTLGGKEVTFSREKFARNNFFLKRLKKEYYELFPACDWVSIRESNRSDKPNTLVIRVGNRE